MISARAWQKIAVSALWVSGLLILAALILIVGYVLMGGAGMLNLHFLLGASEGTGRGGIFPMIVSTVYSTGLALLVAVPLGVGGGIYLAEYATDSPIVKTIRLMIETLAGAPTIVVGLFGLAFFILYFRLPSSLLAVGLTLSILALPIIIRIAEEAIKAVPGAYREGSLALGATKWQTIKNTVLPPALPGILVGVMLGMGRAIGGAAAMLVVAGGGIWTPASLFDPCNPLAYYMFVLFMEGFAEGPVAYGVATVLLLMVLGLTVTTHLISTSYLKKMGVSE
jgi:phosphate transport system permease protein